MTRLLVGAFLLAGGFLAGVTAEHFRGGYFRWRPTGRDNEVELFLRVAFKYGFFATTDKNEVGQDCDSSSVETKTPLEAGDGSKFLISGTDEELYGDTAYYTCTDIRDEGPEDFQWTSGYNVSNITLPARDPPEWTVEYYSCCWLGELKNFGTTPRRWRMRAKIDLSEREDLGGKPNTSPYVDGLPIKTVSYNCGTALIPIKAIDKDNDRLRCRWTNRRKKECDNNCGNPGEGIFEMIEDTCTIRVEPTEAVPGLYAVAVMIEDYPGDTTPGGRRGTKPFSKIPYQFLVNIAEQDVECGRVVTVKPAEACYVVPPDISTPFELILRAYTTYPASPITTIDMNKPDGMRLVGLFEDGRVGNESHFHANLSWSVPVTMIGELTQLCYQAVDSDSITGSEECALLFVTDSFPEALPGNSTPANTSVPIQHDTRNWTLYFTEQVALSGASDRYVTFLYENETIAHAARISESDGAEVSFDRSEKPYSYLLSFRTPEFLKPSTNYTIRLDEGVVVGTHPSCPVPSEANEWQFRTVEPSRATPQEGTATGFVDVEIDCGPSSMTVYIDKFSYPDFEPSVLSFNDPSCHATEVSGKYKVVTMYGKCGTEAIVNEDNTRVSMINNVYLPHLGSTVYNGTLARAGFERIRVNCSIPALRVAYAKLNIDTEMTYFQVDKAEDFKFALKMYPNSSFTNPYRVWDYPARFQQNTTIYFEAKSFEKGVRPFLDECIATPTEDPSPSLHRYVLIKDGCRVDPKVEILRATRKRIRFSVVSFSFIGYNQQSSIYVYCQMSSCDPSDGSCDTNCPEN